jgi:DNA polymerase-3 subunit delta|tara:strand:+ start:1156 stop:2073 length:918 start_codon:yes stop_codon:yes gene_type:complete
MPTSTLVAVRKQIKAGQTDPLYLLIGDDEEEKSNLATEFQNAIEVDLRPFNVQRVYGDDTTIGAVLDAARTFPMLSPRRMVIVLRAEHLLVPKRESETTKRELDDFRAFVQAPEPHASVVLVASKLDGRTSITKLLLKCATVIECEGIRDTNAAASWIREQADRHHVKFDGAAVRLLTQRVGRDIARMRADFDRVLLYASGQKQIGVDDVKAVVGDADLQDDWAITDYIVQRATGKALRELALALDEKKAAEMILGQLRYIVEAKLDSSRIPTAVEALYRTDHDLKTSAGDPRVLLERLVVELCQ